MPDFPNSETYASQYDSILSKSLIEVDKEISVLVKNINGLKSRQEKMSYLLSNRQAILDRLSLSATDSYNEATTGAFKKSIVAVESEFAGIKAPFLNTDLDAFKMIRRDALETLQAHATLDGITVFQELMNYTLTGNIDTLQAGLLGNLDKTAVTRYGQTITATSIDVFGRTVGGTKAERAGVEMFEYVGPPPQRDFCKDYIGSVMSRKDIDEIPSTGYRGMAGDPFYYGGGWNCRHRWAPVFEGK